MSPHDASSRSGSENGASPAGGPEGTDPSTLPGPTNQQHPEEDGMVAVEDAANEEWVSNEGYTPLADLGGTGEMAMFMAFPPSGNVQDDGQEFDNENETGDFAGGGVFFADMNAFSPGPDSMDSAIGDSEEKEECANGQSLEATSSAQQPQDLEEEASSNQQDNDFRVVADQALSALDQEYAQTLQMVLPQSDPDKTTPPDTATSSMNSWTASDWNNSTTADLPASGEDRSNTLTPPSIPSATTELPNIDADAVRRAVQSIRLKAPDLSTNLDQRSFDSSTRAPHQHQIIPSAPLAAFRKKTPKAIKATANLSRSATIAESVLRLVSLSWYLNDKDFRAATNTDDGEGDSTTLVIHVVGADPIECESSELTKILFGPFVRWMSAWKKSNDCNTPPPPVHIRLFLNGPNLPKGAELRPPIDLMPPTSTPNANNGDGADTCCLKSATAVYVGGLYHDWMSKKDEQHQLCRWEPPDFCIAFNAGVWGYSDWHPTIKAINNAEAAIPFVITSYTLEEAEDDEDVMKELIGDGNPCERCIWKPVPNSFGSKQKRETATASKGREYRENAAWQAWKLGKKGIKKS